MTEEESEEEQGAGGIASNIVQLVAFLDPHLPAESKSGQRAKPGRWSLRRAWTFLILASLLGWGLLYAAVHYASSLMPGR